MPTLTPRQLKGGHSHFIVEEEEDHDAQTEGFQSKENDRREKRNQARDQNRPIFDSAQSSPEYEILLHNSEDSDGWMEEGDDEEEPKNIRRLDASLEYIRRREERAALQSNSRRSRFNKNRRSSIVNSRQSYRTSGASNDWGQFQSCVSLEDTSAEFSHTPKKGLTQNFITSHHAQVNRISDIYVKPPKRAIQLENKDCDSDRKFSLHQLKNILAGFGIALFAILFRFLSFKKQ